MLMKLIHVIMGKYKLHRQMKKSRENIEAAVCDIYYHTFGVKLNLNNPQTINEKLQYLKLNDYYENDLITKCVDKVKVKEYIQTLDIGVKCAKTLGIYNNGKEIEWETLPDRMAIKCNHGSGYNVICLDKHKLNIKKTVKKLNKWMKEDFWTFFAEPQYKMVDKKILIEEYLDGGKHTYKFYCFNGIPKVAYVSSDGEDGEKDKYVDYFDMDWKRLNVALEEHLHWPGEIKKPDNFEEMKNKAELVAKQFKFVRVDLYSIGDEIYLSELTFIPTGGYMKLSPEGVDYEWGKWLTL